MTKKVQFRNKTVLFAANNHFSR